MVRFQKLVGVSVYAVVALTFSFGFAQEGESRQTLRQTSADVAALPVAGTSAEFGNSNARTASRSTARNTVYRQASARTDVYDYPGRDLPSNENSGYGLSRNTADARMTNQLSLGRSVSTGNLGSRTQVPQNQGIQLQSYQRQIDSRPPVYNINPNATLGNRIARNTTSSRSPIEQQVSSTLPIRQNVKRQALGSNVGNGGAVAVNPAASVSVAQQAQAQAVQLAQQAQAQQAQAAQTLAQAQQAQSIAAQLAQSTQVARQTALQQSTLGLGGPQYRTAQNCACTPAYNPQAYNPATAAYQTPTLNPNAGSGLGLGGQNFQPLGGFQLPQGVGTPQFGAQGARWWTPFVSGSGVYSPLLKLQNMPIGTYLGQGIIGQPTAYVDGQPVRNLLRYISP